MPALHGGTADAVMLALHGGTADAAMLALHGLKHSFDKYWKTRLTAKLAEFALRRVLPFLATNLFSVFDGPGRYLGVDSGGPPVE